VPNIPKEERRKQLIEAAMRVITEEGPTNATTRRIASEAGAPLGSLHYSFGDKQELIRAVIEHCQQLSHDRLRRIVGPDTGLPAGVHAIITQFRDWVHSAPDFHVAQFELLFWSLRNDPERVIAAQLYEGYFELIREVLGVSVADDLEESRLEDLARDIVAVIDGMMLQVIALGEDGPSSSDVDRYTQAVLAGIDLPAATSD
jgi:AcrR family transcriptional regulator